MKIPVFLLGFCVFASVPSHGAGEVDALTAKFKAARERALGPINDKISTLGKSYLADLDALAAKLQAEGDLDGVVKVREEKANFEKTGELDTDEDYPFPEAREKYAMAAGKIVEEKAEKTDELNEIYLRELVRLQEELTKAGKIDEALKAKAIAVSLSSESVPATTAPATPSSTPWTVPAETPDVLEGGTFIDPAVFPVGRHRLRDKVTIGERDPVKPGKVYIQEGTEISCTGNGEIFICAGHGYAYKASFVTAVLEGGLVGDWEFQSCVFDRTPMRKGDGWAGRPHASQWKFENCSFSGEFFDKWRTKDIGFQVDRCTFDRVEFPDLEYHESADKVAGEEWLAMRNCRFTNCDIPLSLLVTTSDCVFENCSFRNDEKLPGFGSNVTTTIYAKDSNSRLRDLPENVKIEIKDASEFTGQAGANLQ